MFDTTSSDDDDVLTGVVGSFVSLKGISGQVLKLIGVTTDRLAHHVVTEGVVVGGFESCALQVLVEGFIG